MRPSQHSRRIVGEWMSCPESALKILRCPSSTEPSGVLSAARHASDSTKSSSSCPRPPPPASLRLVAVPPAESVPCAGSDRALRRPPDAGERKVPHEDASTSLERAASAAPRLSASSCASSYARRCHTPRRTAPHPHCSSRRSAMRTASWDIAAGAGSRPSRCVPRRSFRHRDPCAVRLLPRGRLRGPARGCRSTGCSCFLSAALPPPRAAPCSYQRSHSVHQRRPCGSSSSSPRPPRLACAEAASRSSSCC